MVGDFLKCIILNSDNLQNVEMKRKMQLNLWKIYLLEDCAVRNCKKKNPNQQRFSLYQISKWISKTVQFRTLYCEYSNLNSEVTKS